MSYMSSNINKVIRVVLNSLIFFYEEILHAQKKSTKSIKSKQATFTQMFFYVHKKHKKHKTSNKRFPSS